ncbi:MAG: hypothetical protein IT325_09780, partial [Anaerolineae bacterium]|nr:hypothetical protein [Anaerolineae bacterium]
PPPSSSSSSSSSNPSIDVVVDSTAIARRPPVDDDDSGGGKDARAEGISDVLAALGVGIAAAEPKLQGWAHDGITDRQLRTAVDTAKRMRQREGSRQRISAAYLDSILRNPIDGADDAPRDYAGMAARFKAAEESDAR